MDESVDEVDLEEEEDVDNSGTTKSSIVYTPCQWRRDETPSVS